MEEPPHIDVVWLVDVEDEVGRGGQRPGPETGEIELVGEPQRTCLGVAPEMTERLLDLVDEATGQRRVDFA